MRVDPARHDAAGLLRSLGLVVLVGGLARLVLPRSARARVERLALGSCGFAARARARLPRGSVRAELRLAARCGGQPPGSGAGRGGGGYWHGQQAEAEAGANADEEVGAEGDAEARAEVEAAEAQAQAGGGVGGGGRRGGWSRRRRRRRG